MNILGKILIQINDWKLVLYDGYKCKLTMITNFQRHAAVWEVQDQEKLVCGNILEKQVNWNILILLFDMHGDIKFNGGTDDAQSFRTIMGIWNVERRCCSCHIGCNREELLSMILDRSDSNAPNQGISIYVAHSQFKEVTLTREDRYIENIYCWFADSILMTDLLELLKDDDTRKVWEKW